MRRRKHTAPGATGWTVRLGWSSPCGPRYRRKPILLRPWEWAWPPWATPILPGCRADRPQGHLPGVVRRKFGAGHENTGGEKVQMCHWLWGPGSSTKEKLESLHAFVLLAWVQRSNLFQCLSSVSKVPDSTLPGRKWKTYEKVSKRCLLRMSVKLQKFPYHTGGS